MSLAFLSMFLVFILPSCLCLEPDLCVVCCAHLCVAGGPVSPTQRDTQSKHSTQGPLESFFNVAERRRFGKRVKPERAYKADICKGQSFESILDSMLFHKELHWENCGTDLKTLARRVPSFCWREWFPSFAVGFFRDPVLLKRPVIDQIHESQNHRKNHFWHSGRSACVKSLMQKTFQTASTCTFWHLWDCLKK